jgi:hypothetical protein
MWFCWRAALNSSWFKKFANLEVCEDWEELINGFGFGFISLG